MFTVLRSQVWKGRSLIISNMGTLAEFLNPDQLSRRKGSELAGEKVGPTEALALQPCAWSAVHSCRELRKIQQVPKLLFFVN